jgi:hypothetical protein
MQLEVWRIEGMILTGDTRNTERTTCHRTILSIKNPTQSASENFILIPFLNITNYKPLLIEVRKEQWAQDGLINNTEMWEATGEKPIILQIRMQNGDGSVMVTLKNMHWT